MSDPKNKLKSIKSSVFSRGLSLTKTTLSMSAQMAGHAVGGLFSDQEKGERLKTLLTNQMSTLSKELGELKGSLMKAGQMLSMYGEYFLPPEANDFLRKLQNQSPALEYAALHKVLLAELGVEKLEKLEIEEEPIGTASIGQVHRARIKGTNQFISLKIQYPGVDKAIDSDLAALKRLLSLSKLIPKDLPTDHLFNEVRVMLQQEVDYKAEAKYTNEFREILKADSRFAVPQTFDEYSSSHILATSFEVGIPVLSNEILSLPIERRNKIGIAITELYLKELFELGMIQTDPHFGNYLVKLDPEGKDDILVLLDFGATRKYDLKFLNPYRKMVVSAILSDAKNVVKYCGEVGFLRPNDNSDLQKLFVDLCFEICEPFFKPNDVHFNPKLMDKNGNYNWAKSDLPTRLTKRGKQMALATRLRPPPAEIIFIDRKMIGLFIFLQKLGTSFNTRNLLQSYIDKIDLS